MQNGIDWTWNLRTTTDRLKWQFYKMKKWFRASPPTSLYGVGVRGIPLSTLLEEHRPVNLAVEQEDKVARLLTAEDLDQ